MNEIQAIILFVLRELDQPCERTKLVKLVYLVDCTFFRHFGRTLTGLQYGWDHFGPNAVGNAIVQEASKLVREDAIRLQETFNYHGSPMYLYTLAPGQPRQAVRLAEVEQAITKDVVKRYGSLNVQTLTAATKRTEPFKKAKQYELLVMEQSPEYKSFLEARSKDKGLAAELEEALGEQRVEEISLEELKRRYNIA